MTRDKTGKNQETNAVNTNAGNSQAWQNVAQNQIKPTSQSIWGLVNQPGYSAADLAAMKGERQSMLEGTYGGMQEGVARHAAQTGNANDAGLAAQEQTMNRQRTNQEAMGNFSVADQQAQQVLNTRRQVPNLFQNYMNSGNQSSNQLAGINGSMINGRMNVDNTMPFGQQLLLSGMQGAGQVGAAYAGKG